MTNHNSGELLQNGYPDEDSSHGYSRRVVVAILGIGILAGILKVGELHKHTENSATLPGTFGHAPEVSRTPDAKGGSSHGRGIPGPPVRFVRRWRGVVTIAGAERIDLDAIPPMISGQQADISGDSKKVVIKANSNALLADFGKTPAPTATSCENAISHGTTSQTEPLTADDIICVVTSKGCIARLQVIDANYSSRQPRVIFHITVWDIDVPMSNSQ